MFFRLAEFIDVVITVGVAFVVLEKLGENLIALPGKGEIFFSDSSFIMRGERQRHLVKTNINIGMVIDFLSFPGDPVDESDGV
jgi:hypothetical protein